MKKFKIQSYKEASFSEFGNEMTEKAGELLCEALKIKGHSKMLTEQFGINFKEDVTTTTGSGAYTTMLSTTLYEAAIQNISDIMALVVPNDDLKNKGGFGAYKIPKMEPTIAVEVAEGSVVNYFDDGFDSLTVTPRKVVSGTAITWEMLKRGMTDFIKYVLQNAADAVSRKLASDIVNGLAAGAANDKTGGMTYDNVIDARAEVESATHTNGTPYGFIADAFVVSTNSYATLEKTTDWKNHVYYANVRPGDDFVIDRPALMFGNLKIIKTPFLTSALGLVIDTRKTAMLVRESDLETFEGALPGRPYDREVVAMMSYVLAIIYSAGVCTISA